MPFASAHALFGLSKLAVWWLRLGIDIERIKPGHPTQNGRHERIHLTLKKEATKPAAHNRELAYPFHDRTVTVTQCGRICMAPHKIMLSTVFAGQNVGVKQVGDKIWLVSFMDYDLGFFDEETTRLEPTANPFEAKVLPMCPE